MCADADVSASLVYNYCVERCDIIGAAGSSAGGHGLRAVRVNKHGRSSAAELFCKHKYGAGMAMEGRGVGNSTWMEPVTSRQIFGVNRCVVAIANGVPCAMQSCGSSILNRP